jgi:choline dehydrogenase
MNTLDHRRWSTATGYLATAGRRRNLTIAPNSLVRRVLMAGPRAIGVEVDGDRVPNTIAGAEVILCAGAVGSAQVLG